MKKTSKESLEKYDNDKKSSEPNSSPRLFANMKAQLTELAADSEQAPQLLRYAVEGCCDPAAVYNLIEKNPDLLEAKGKITGLYGTHVFEDMTAFQYLTLMDDREMAAFF